MGAPKVILEFYNPVVLITLAVGFNIGIAVLAYWIGKTWFANR